jgi:hypothetical protein
MAMPHPLFPFLSPQCGRCHRGRGASEISPGLTIDCGDREPSPQPLSGAAVLVARSRMGLFGNRRSSWRDELAGADSAKQASSASPAGSGLGAARLHERRRPNSRLPRLSRLSRRAVERAVERAVGPQRRACPERSRRGSAVPFPPVSNLDGSSARPLSSLRPS